MRFFFVLFFTLMLSVNCHAKFIPFSSNSYSVDLNKLVEINIPLKMNDSDTLYLFWCSGGPDSETDKLSDETGINHVSPLMCVLNKGTERSEVSLLPNASGGGPWHSEGMFSSHSLAKTNGVLTRVFDIKGSTVSIILTDIKNGSNKKVSSLNLKVVVK